ncbi:hypothetical protein [Antarcticirhabdus aurantiaca]|uniref:Uncharacterized protein n=1 Tax=Antarcticirhabdus aurantiaca TaxID=2606717 RepID=A0ACD4NIP4_9HYPH|nr:hypothetical protein [Antarcticirhabdus aurantiaca]WAJ26648.1 hypothetical protein OXU80_17460 [Jeongeuplla avenae]
MRIANLAAVTAILLVSTMALGAQEKASAPAMVTEDQVYIDVDGAAVQVDTALAAEACELDQAAVVEMSAAKMEESGLDPKSRGNMAASEAAAEGTTAAPDKSNETVTTSQGTADPSTSAPGGQMLALAVCQITVETAARLGVPQANEIVTD